MDGDTFYFIGYNFGFLSVPVVVIFAIMAIATWILTKRPPYGTLALLAVSVACWAWQLPSNIVTASIFAAFPVIYYRVSRPREQENRSRVPVWIVLLGLFWAMLMGTVQSMSYFLAPHRIALHTASIVEEKGKFKTVLQIGSIKVQGVKYRLWGDLWSITGANRWISLTESEVYVDSSGHIYSGSAVGRAIAKWPHVEPKLTVNGDVGKLRIEL